MNFSVTFKKFICFFISITYMCLIFYLSSQPMIIHTERGNDKFIHCLEYYILGILITSSINPDRKEDLKIFYILLFCILYGFIDEMHQYFVPARSCDPLDWIADSVGSILGIICTLYLLETFQNKGKKQKT